MANISMNGCPRPHACVINMGMGFWSGVRFAVGGLGVFLTSTVTILDLTSYSVGSIRGMNRLSADAFPISGRSNRTMLTNICRGLGRIYTSPRVDFLCCTRLTDSSVLNNNNIGSGLVRTSSLLYGCGTSVAGIFCRTHCGNVGHTGALVRTLPGASVGRSAGGSVVKRTGFLHTFCCCRLTSVCKGMPVHLGPNSRTVARNGVRSP